MVPQIQHSININRQSIMFYTTINACSRCLRQLSGEIEQKACGADKKIKIAKNATTKNVRMRDTVEFPARERRHDPPFCMGSLVTRSQFAFLFFARSRLTSLAYRYRSSIPIIN